MNFTLSIGARLYSPSPIFLLPSEYYVYEPLTAATLETIASSQSLETSYVRVTAFHAKDIFMGSPANPTGIQVDKLKILDQGLDAHVRSRCCRTHMPAAQP